MTWSSMEIFLINFPIKRDARENEKAYEERAQKSQANTIVYSDLYMMQMDEWKMSNISAPKKKYVHREIREGL